MHPLQQQIQRIARQAQRLRWRYAITAWLGWLLSAALLIGLLDYFVQFRDLGLRILASLIVLIGAGVGVWRLVWPVWSRRESDVAIAQQIEMAFPRLRGQLSSAVAFLQQETDDPTAGSAALRRSVVAAAQGQMENVDDSVCLKRQPARRALGFVSGLLLALAALTAWQPTYVLLAAKRLALPWQNHPWPRQHHLTITEAPSKIAAGDDFEVVVRDRNGVLPDEVFIQYEMDGQGADQAVRQSMEVLQDKAVHRLVNVSRSFRFRVSGGDDDTMPWQSVEVVLRPTVSNIEIQITPPAYSGLPISTVQRDFRALANSTATVRGDIEATARAARLIFRSPRLRFAIPGRLQDRHFEISDKTPWPLPESGTYWFEVMDRQGLIGGDERKWQVHIIADQPPTVSTENTFDEGFVTPTASLPLRVLVKDDLAVREVELVYDIRRAAAVGTGPDREANVETAPALEDLSTTENPARTLGQDPPVVRAHSIRLYQAPSRRVADDGKEISVPLQETSLAEGDKRSIDHAWNLVKLTNLEPGDMIEFEIRATDFLGKSGSSEPRKLTIITPQEFENRMTQRQSRIIAGLAEVLEMQRQAKGQASEVEDRLAQRRTFAKPDLDRLHGSELTQRQIAARLSDQPDGIPHQIRRVTIDLQNNQIDSPEVFRRLQELLRTISKLREEELPAIQSSLTTAMKNGRQTLDQNRPAAEVHVDDSLTKPLQNALRSQQAVIDILEKLIGNLSQWDNYRRFAREISQIAREEAEIDSENEQLMLDTLTREPDEFRSAERTRVRRLSQRQFELAGRFERVQARMESMRQDLVTRDPLVAATLADAIEVARRLAISGQMREGGRQLNENRFDLADRQFNDVLEGLEQLLNVLANRRETELNRIARQLDDASRQLAGIQETQRRISEQTQAAANAPPAKQKQQLQGIAKDAAALAKQIESLTRQLRQLKAAGAATAAAGAQQSTSQAARSAQNGNQAETANQMQRAGKQLADAQQQLDQRRAEMNQNRTQQELNQLQQAIQGLLQRQSNLHESTQQMNRDRQAQGRLTRNQAQMIQQLAQQQIQLASEANAWSQRITVAAAFQFSLRGIHREMARAGAGMDRLETGESVLSPQKEALARLEQLRQAFEQQPGATPPANQANNQSPGPKQQSPPPDPRLLQFLAELRLARMMQQEIYQKTVRLEQLQSRQQLTKSQQTQFEQLAEEQGKLADIIYNLMESQTTPSSNEDPTSPDNPLRRQPDDDLNQQLDRELNKQLDEMAPGF